MKRVVLAATALAAMAATPPAWAAGPTGDPSKEAPRPDLPIEGVITKPDWLQQPGANELSENYPRLARALSMEGYAQITCAITETGTLEDCKVDWERPVGFGFGPAALAISQDFRMKPVALDGTPVGGSLYTTRIRFKMDYGNTRISPAASSASEPSSPPPSPTALELGRRLAAASKDSEFISAAIETYLANIRRQTAQGLGVTPQEFEATFGAIEAARTADQPTLTDLMGAYYASTYSEDELRQLIAFMSSPAGQAWASHQKDRNAALGRNTTRFLGQIETDAGRQLCSGPGCPSAVTASASPAPGAQRTTP